MNKNLQVHKSLNDELMQATFVVMVPDIPDAHGDITSVEEVRKACFNFNKNYRESKAEANLFHITKTETYEFCESYITPVDFVLNDRVIKSGTWLATIQCLDNSLWTLVKSGKINGLSIGALARVENIDDTEE